MVSSTSPSRPEPQALQQVDAAAVLVVLVAELLVERPADVVQQEPLAQPLLEEFPQFPAEHPPVDKVVVDAVDREPAHRPNRKQQPRLQQLPTHRRVDAARHPAALLVVPVVVEVELLQRLLRRRHRFSPEQLRPRRTPIRNCLFLGFRN
jgi:hypothetical protein